MKTFVRVYWIVLLICPLIAFGDDAFMGTRGGNVFPIIRNNKIRMSKEEIRIKMLKDSCTVKCKFWFTNESNDTVTSVYMGFPDYFEGIAQGSTALRNFSCKVNSFPMEINKERQVTSPATDSTLNNFDSTYANYEYWYCWYVEKILPHQTILVENTYTGEWGGNVEGIMSFSYLIGTAQTWYNTIGNGKVVFDYSEVASTLFIDTSYEDLSKGMIRKFYDDSAVFLFNDYYPEWNEQLEVKFYPYWRCPYMFSDDTETSYPIEEEYGTFAHYSKERLRLMRNEIFARHGYLFKDENLKLFFEQRSWYRPDPAFSEKKLNKYEIALIELLKRLEKKN
ncbi:MAG: YARHG domain-containing protein [Bacteroidota bacterium]